MTERDPDLPRPIDESRFRHLLDSCKGALETAGHPLLAPLYHSGAIDDRGVFNGPAAHDVEWEAAESGQ